VRAACSVRSTSRFSGCASLGMKWDSLYLDPKRRRTRAPRRRRWSKFVVESRACVTPYYHHHQHESLDAFLASCCGYAWFGSPEPPETATSSKSIRRVSTSSCMDSSSSINSTTLLWLQKRQEKSEKDGTNSHQSRRHCHRTTQRMGQIPTIHFSGRF